MSDLRSIYSVFNPAPLEADQDDLYVELDELRGSPGVGIAARLERKVRWADGLTCQVLAGHRGSGKSTELRRLKRRLEEPGAESRAFFVVLVQGDQHLDRNDVDFPEVLIAVLRQVASQLEEELGIALEPSFFKDRLARLKRVLGTTISFEGASLSAGLVQLATTIRSSPDARAEVRKALEPDTGNWLKAANDVIGKAVQELGRKGYSGLVVIVDDLDKMVTRAHDSGGSTTEYLFVHRCEQLRAFGCHMVYTMPLELAYSHHEQTLRTLYGGHVPVVPMTKVVTPPPSPGPFAPGIARFAEIIAARLRRAGAGEKDLFATAAVRDALIVLCGGQPTELMTLVREAMVTHGLPIGLDALERCRVESARSFPRQLRADHRPILEQVRRTGRYERRAQDDAAFRELLESRAILLYMNKEEWYALNPALEALGPFAPPEPAAAGAPA